MHILLLNMTFRGNGEYFRALQFARQLHMRGHEVTLMCVARDKRYRARRAHVAGFTYFETPHWAPGLDAQEGWGPIDLVFRLGHAAIHRADLVFSFSHKPTTVIPAKFSRLLWGCPWVSDWCDLWGGPEGLLQNFVMKLDAHRNLPPHVRAWRRFIFGLDERRERRVRRSADLVTAICSWLSERALEFGIPEECVRVIPSGAPTDSIQPGDKVQARRSLGIKSGDFALGYMSNYHHDEDLLLGAFARLLEAFPRAVLLVIGPPFEHPERHLTPEQMERSVRCLGKVPYAEIATPMAASDVLLMPLSDTGFNWGRWPNKIGDYLAAGRPVVSTAVGDAPDLVRRHEIGWVGEASVSGLATAMAEAWDGRGQWQERGRLARQVAETELSWGAQTDRLIDAVRTVTGLDLSPP